MVVAAAHSAAAQGSITGTVTYTDTGGPASQVLVNVYDVQRRPVTIAYTLADGSYSVLLAAGTYYVFALQSGYVPQVYSGIPCAAEDCFADYLGVLGTPVSVGIAPVRVDFALDRGATLTGKVTRASDGTPVSGVQIELTDSSTSFIRDSAQSGADGIYSIGGLPPGSYLARTFGGPSDLSSVVYGGPACPRPPRAISG